MPPRLCLSSGMHIVIGFLTSVVTLLWLLHRLAEMGINLGGLNPFYWRRRRAWAKKYHGDPIYAVEDPMELAALYVVAVAKLEGEISAEQKTTILQQFSDNFSLDDRAASQLLGASVHLLGHPQLIRNQLDGLLKRTGDRFTADQVESLIAMMQAALSPGTALSEEQAELIEAVRKRYAVEEKSGGTWG